jgi:signal transduction histidine kinase
MSNKEPDAGDTTTPTSSPAPSPASETLGTNFRSMAHELRTPIGAIIALAEMIESEQFGPVGDPRYQAYARDIGDSARLSLKIVAATLERTSIESGLLDDGFAATNVADVIDTCTHAMHQSAHAAQVAVEHACPQDLPKLIANAAAIRQILLNLLSNAIKFTPKGGKVTVIVEAKDGMIITVGDTGVGMTSLDIKVLVAGTANEQDLSATQGLSPTSGIGFSLVRQLAAAMEAKLNIMSERGVGTEVSLTFPPGKIIAVTPNSE